MNPTSLDCHCHLDRFDHPIAVAKEAERRRTFIIAVTNLPSHFRVGLPNVRGLSQVRLALGLHPLAAGQHADERSMFLDELDHTSFVGEVGLDLSREGIATSSIQIESFRFVAELLTTRRKIVSLHSRRAEREVLDILCEFKLRPCIFHWYSGPTKLINSIVEYGHYFSVNPAMIRSENGQRIIARIPKERLLTETDGPYVRLERSPAKPWDVGEVENYVATLWNMGRTDVQSQIWKNFRALLNACEVLNREK